MWSLLNVALYAAGQAANEPGWMFVLHGRAGQLSAMNCGMIPWMGPHEPRRGPVSDGQRSSSRHASRSPGAKPRPGRPGRPVQPSPAQATRRATRALRVGPSKYGGTASCLVQRRSLAAHQQPGLASPRLTAVAWRGVAPARCCSYCRSRGTWLSDT